jgi:hypothetical protein
MMTTVQNTLRKNRQRTSGSSAEQKKPASKRELLSLCLALLSLLGTFLTLVGYGVALSVSQFGLPPESLFNTPFEIIGLSVWGILYFFNNIGKFSFLAYYQEMIGQLWPALICGLIGIGSVYFFAKLQPNIERIRKRFPRLAKYAARPKRQDGLTVLVQKLLLFFMLFWLTIPILFLLPVLLFTVASFLLSMAPFIGMSAGNDHIKNDVLAPAVCMPLSNRQQRLKPAQRTPHINYANCISIKTDRMPEDLRGRVVFSTSSSVILFDPDSGIAVRMPTKDATIQAIDSVGRKIADQKTNVPPNSPKQ